MTISAGIPTLNNLTLTRKVIERVIKMPVHEILVSVNDPGSQRFDFLELNKLDCRLRVVLQEVNLGLYGNFRYLAQNTSGDYFFWNCVDDYIPPSFILDFKKIITSEKLSHTLFVPPWQRSLFDYEKGEWKSEHENIETYYWNDENLDNDSLFNINPSFMFGIWDREYLNHVFPKVDFDWLDTHLLTQAALAGGIKRVETGSVMLIGIRTKKNPTHVNGKFHNLVPWLRYSLRLLGQRKWTKQLLTSFFQGLKNRLLFSAKSCGVWLRSQFSH